MTLDELMESVDMAYEKATHGDGGLVLAYHKDNDHVGGDSLAKFIAIEVTETFDKGANDYEQLMQAAHAISKAAEELSNAAEELYDLAHTIE